MAIKEFIYFNKKGIIVFTLIILALITGIIIYYLSKPKTKEKTNDEELEIDLVKEEPVIEEEQILECYCDIKGKVKKEGVYKLDCNSRIIDAINAAGGLTKDADTSVLNLSKKITDSMVIKVYSKTEVKNYIKTLETDNKKQELCINDQVNNNACIETSTITTKNGLVNINTASLNELMSLEGIGESKAKAIIEYREHTPFTSIDDIKKVSGIGETLYAKIKENITV